MKRNLPILVVVVVAVVAMLWLSHRSRQNAPGSMLGGPAPAAGKTAPAFSLVDVRTGQKVQLSDYRGKAVLLNFWATWCPPCREEIPWLVDLQKQYSADGLQVLGVSMDDGGQQTVAKFASDMSMNYPVLQGNDQVGGDYGGVQALPTTFYIGRDGKIVASHMGAPSRGTIERNVKTALGSR